jgi:predicted GIY-YIG superfamily endonuclease
MHFIYELVDPCTNQTRYIGMSTDLNTRYLNHLASTDGSSDKRAWIRDLKVRGLKPILNLLEQVEDISLAREREKAWIIYYIEQGHPLSNVQHGIIPSERYTRFTRNIALLPTDLYKNRASANAVQANLENLPVSEIWLEEKPTYHVQELFDASQLTTHTIADTLQIPITALELFRKGAPTGAHRIRLFLRFFSWYYNRKFTIENVTDITLKESDPQVWEHLTWNN